MRPRGSSRVDHILGQQVALRSKSKPERLVLELGALTKAKAPPANEPTIERTLRVVHPGLKLGSPSSGSDTSTGSAPSIPARIAETPALTPLCDLHPWGSPLSKRPPEDKNAHALDGC
jgi:hypothetical protein